MTVCALISVFAMTSKEVIAYNMIWARSGRDGTSFFLGSCGTSRFGTRPFIGLKGSQIGIDTCFRICGKTSLLTSDVSILILDPVHYLLKVILPYSRELSIYVCFFQI
jgi:hypothetical protein